MNPVHIAIAKILGAILVYFIVSYIIGSVVALALGVRADEEEKANNVIASCVLMPILLGWMLLSVFEYKRRRVTFYLLSAFFPFARPPDDGPLDHIP